MVIQRDIRLRLGLLACAAVLVVVAPPAAAARVERIRPVAVVNVGALARGAGVSGATRRFLPLRTVAVAPQRWAAAAAATPVLGGASAPASPVTRAGGARAGEFAFAGISNTDMETGGTGSYANTNGVLEPPDQGLCAGAGYVLETINDALRVYTTAGAPVTATSIPLSQFFARSPVGGVLGDFISDPRCLYDASTRRWFVTMLDLSQLQGLETIDDHNFLAVSETANPAGAWRIYSFDVTDNGLHGTPSHAGCIGAPFGVLAGCLGDQPALGIDAHGVYITDNEYAFATVFPISPPISPPFQQIPVLRSGVAQLYALSKRQLIAGSMTTLVRVDAGTIPFPGPREDGPWQSLSPATAVPRDTTRLPSDGVEYLLSDVGLPVGHNAGQIVVWAWTNTASLDSGSPRLSLLHRIVSIPESFFAPDPSFPASQPFGAYQGVGPHPLAAKSGDPEEQLNANDDRMSWVTLSGGHLWTALNTLLPASAPGATGLAGEKRVGIMYLELAPSLTSSGGVDAGVLRDGYISVPDANVLFGSVGPRIDGATVMTFTLAGRDYFPSVAYARLDGVPAGQAPVVRVALAGQAPEDGFTGLGLLASQLGLPDVPPCNPCVARWGDYSASQVGPGGCIWGAAEYVPATAHDKSGNTDWGTGIVRNCPARLTTGQHRRVRHTSHHRTRTPPPPTGRGK